MRLRPVVLSLVVIAGSGLAACSGANSYCLKESDYQRARVVPELHGADGLAMPDSPSALRLPPEPVNPAPFGVRTADGAGECLDRPPPMIASPRAKEPAKDDAAKEPVADSKS